MLAFLYLVFAVTIVEMKLTKKELIMAKQLGW